MLTRRFFALFFAALLAGGAAAVPGAAQPAAGEGALTFAPEHPQPGQPVTVTYDPQATAGTLGAPAALELVVRNRRPDYRILPMKEEGGRWTARFTPRADARFLRLYVQSDSLKDRNRGAVGWGQMLYGADGAPVRGAHLARADFLRDHHGDDVSRASLRQAYRREQALSPDHLVAEAHLQALRAEAAPDAARADALRQAALDEVDAARQQYAGDPAKLREVQRAYYVLGRRDMAQSVDATLMERAPAGPEARLAAFRRATAEGQTPARTRGRVDDFLQRFPGSFFESSLYEALFKKYQAAAFADSARVDASHLDSMRWAGRQWIRTEKINPARAHGQLARALAEAGRYEEAQTHARQAVAMATEEAPTEYSIFKTGGAWGWAPAPRTPAERRREARRQRGQHRATLGRIHFRREEYAQAADVLAKAVEERPGDDALWTDLAKAREEAGQPEAAFAAAEEAVRRAPTNGAGRALFRRLYAARHGSEEGLPDAVARLARGTLLRERLRRPAPPLHLTRLDSSAAGGEADAAGEAARSDTLRSGTLRSEALRPEALEGKVLVLDFWASWCGPCRTAFPHLQTTYEQYRDAQDVQFLVVNTSWNDTKARAHRFIQRAGYTFPVWWDEEGQLAEALGVRGIPATVLIGKNGRVQYHENGFGGPAQYVDNLTLRIDLLRSL